MFQIRKAVTGGIPVFYLSGEIDETVKLQEQLQFSESEVVFNVRDVIRINSAGVRGWIHYFETLQRNQVQFSFVECSPAIVDQMNLISNFLANGKAISIAVPFSCQSCSYEFIEFFSISSLIQSHPKEPTAQCAKCGGESLLDEIKEEYLGFLNRLK
jgi:anti-anti-sigma regulatory factor